MKLTKQQISEYPLKDDWLYIPKILGLCIVGLASLSIVFGLFILLIEALVYLKVGV